MRTVLLTGGTGLIGSALSTFLSEEGFRIIVLTRRSAPFPGQKPYQYAHWDPVKGELDEQALLEADYIIHLAGTHLGAGRWSEARKRDIKASRVLSTRLIAERLSRLPHKVQAFISASAIGYYESHSATLLTEEEPAGDDFLGHVCQAWESEALQIGALGIRVVILRTGLVLDDPRGLLARLAGPMRFGLAVIPGNGEQWLSWIHHKDLIRLYGCAMESPAMRGVFNAVSPFPVTMQQTVGELARLMKGHFYVPVYVPAFLWKGIWGEKGTEVLKSRKISAAKLLQTGFEFSFPTLGSALKEIYGRRR